MPWSSGWWPVLLSAVAEKGMLNRNHDRPMVFTNRIAAGDFGLLRLSAAAAIVLAG
jgi:hypothetical protein